MLRCTPLSFTPSLPVTLRLRKLVEPILDPGGQGFVDLSYTPDGALLPESSRVWQFGLALVQADAVGKTGEGDACRQIVYYGFYSALPYRVHREAGLLFLESSHVSWRW